MGKNAIELLVPDLPAASDLLPWLEQIDRNRWYTNFGPLNAQFEAGLRHLLLGGSYAEEPLSLTTVSSGTAALYLAVRALRLPKGTRVLLPSFTFPATAAVVIDAGLEPVFGDVDRLSWQLTPAIARAALARLKIGLVMPVATFGRPLPAASWDAFVEDTGVPVVIDAAAAFGNQVIPSRATVCFSFHATKPFGIGEGGLVASADADVIARAKRLSNFGIEASIVDESGCNGKLSEYHAAVGLAQLSRWARIQQRRQEVFTAYGEELAKCDFVSMQEAAPDWVRSVLALKLDAGIDLESVRRSLVRSGIATRRWYTPALHEQPAFRGCPRLFDSAEGLVNTKPLSASILGLPFHSFLTIEDVRRVVSSLRDAVRALSVPPGPRAKRGRDGLPSNVVEART